MDLGLFLYNLQSASLAAGGIDILYPYATQDCPLLGIRAQAVLQLHQGRLCRALPHKPSVLGTVTGGSWPLSQDLMGWEGMWMVTAEQSSQQLLRHLNVLALRVWGKSQCDSQRRPGRSPVGMWGTSGPEAAGTVETK